MKVLIPLDGSTLAEHSLSYLAALRPLGISEVTLVSVIEPATVPARRGAEDEERESNLLAAYLGGIADELRVHTALEVQTRIIFGPAAAALLREVETYKPDCLIIATHGSSGLTRWRFGSVADKVIRGAGCPTLVVGPKTVEKEQWLQERLMPAFRSILVPLDGSELAEQALPLAEEFADAHGAQLHLVSVVNVAAMGGAWASIAADLPEDLTREAGDYLREVGDRTPGLAKARLAARIGSPAQALTDYITENAVDLVIMTSHGRGGAVRAALGSTADRLLGGAAPVLIVRGQE